MMGLVDQVDDQNLKVLSISDDSVINMFSKFSSNDLSIQFVAEYTKSTNFHIACG